jgi:hypothetical protein
MSTERETGTEVLPGAPEAGERSGPTKSGGAASPVWSDADLPCPRCQEAICECVDMTCPGCRAALPGSGSSEGGSGG